MDATLNLPDILAKHGAWLRSEPDGQRADLHGADLHGADLHGADLCGADLCGADLHGAYLHGADLCGADLRVANLCGAYLHGADLSGAYLHGADLRVAEGILSIGPIGSRGDMLYAVMHDAGPMLKTGCFWGTVYEFTAQVAKTHGSNPHALAYMAAVQFINVMMPTAPVLP